MTLLFGLCGLKDGDLKVVLGASCSARASGMTARFGFRGPPSFGALLLGGLSLDNLLPLVDVVDTLTTRLEVGGSGGGTRVVGDVHVA